MRYRYVSIVSVLVFLYFCTPKVDLFRIPGVPTGFRIQDIICLVLISNTRIFNISFGILTRKNVALLLLTCLVMNFVGSLYFGTTVNFVLGWIRLLQYFIVGVACFVALCNDRPVFSLIFAFQAILSCLQYLKIAPVIDPGRGVLRTNEYAGSFGTAAELAYFCTILSAIFVLTNRKRQSIISVALPVLNGVRAYFLTIPVYFYARVHKRLIKLMLILPLIMSMAIISYTFYELLQHFASSLSDAVLRIPPDLAFLKESGDVSGGDIALGHRIGKWATALSLLSQSPAAVFGSGMYSAGGALDGGILRLFLELGIPLTAFILFRLGRLDFSVLLVFFVTNVFFDGYISSITMPLFFGLLLLRHSNKVAAYD